MTAAGASLGRSARRRAGAGAGGWQRGGGERRRGEGAAGGDSAGRGGACTGARGGGASRGLREPSCPLRARSSAWVPAPVAAASSSRPPCRAPLPAPWEGESMGSPSAFFAGGLMAGAGPRAPVM